jgi:SAM-dependent methyltransferase
VKNNIFEKPILFILKKLDLLSLYSLKRIGPLKEDGWFRSYKEDTCVDAEGYPLPWMTYPSIEFLKNRIRKDMIVFEYGCGESTLWWASRVKEVVSVEHNKDWFEKVLHRIPANVNIFHIGLEYGGSYSRKIMEYRDKFDIVVIDGRDRVNCVLNALDALKPDGVIIFDNSDRKEYEKGYEYLLKSGFRKIEFVGFAPISCVKAETGIFFRKNNCLGI